MKNVTRHVGMLRGVTPMPATASGLPRWGFVVGGVKCTTPTDGSLAYATGRLDGFPVDIEVRGGGKRLMLVSIKPVCDQRACLIDVGGKTRPAVCERREKSYKVTALDTSISMRVSVLRTEEAFTDYGVPTFYWM